MRTIPARPYAGRTRGERAATAVDRQDVARVAPGTVETGTRRVGSVVTSVVVAVVAGGRGGSPSAAGRGPAVRTILGPGTLDSPAALALDSAGDVFVADTGHCRVLVIPSALRALLRR